jgi:hypothetical protein
VEGLAEAADVIAWWSQPSRRTRTIFELLGAGEDVVDGFDGFAGGLLWPLGPDLGWLAALIPVSSCSGEAQVP